jgi:hypothetical protein
MASMSTRASITASPGGPHAAPAAGLQVVVATDAIFAVVLERLNREATLTLVEQLGREVDASVRVMIAERVSAELAARERSGRRGCLRWLLVAALVGGAGFIAGVVGGRATATLTADAR